MDRNKEIILDVLISPENDVFDENWHQFFGNFVVEGDSNDYVALRTIVKYNPLKGEYDLERKALNSWPDSNADLADLGSVMANVHYRKEDLLSCKLSYL